MEQTHRDYQLRRGLPFILFFFFLSRYIRMDTVDNPTRSVYLPCNVGKSFYLYRALWVSSGVSPSLFFFKVKSEHL